MALTRREFLAATNAAALLLVLESCSLGPIGRSGAPPGRPYDVALKLLRDALRASPDHLAERAAEAVASKDASKIVEFVRSQVAVVPPLVLSDDAATSRRWGSRATLRSGLGTLRDRAELLAELLRRAGFDAQVRIAGRPSTLSVDAIYASRPAKFAPDTSRMSQAKSALKAGGFPSPPAARTFDPGPDPMAAILAALPSSLQVAGTRPDLLPATVPVVVFQDKGKTRYALATGEVAMLESAPANLTPRDADAMREIAITVSAASNPALGGQTPRGRLVDLATASWPADQVVGRQVLLTFQPPQGGKAMLDAGLAALPVRAPVLRVQGAKDLLAFGSMITVHGDVLGAPGAASTDGPYGSLKQLDAAGKQAGLARVKSAQVSVNAAAFPDIELAMSVLDAAGAPVDGLDASSFTVKEQGKPVGGFALYSNAPVQPRARVLVVYDGYISIAPTLFPSAEAKASFESALATSIADQAAQTPFDVQVVSLGATPVGDAWAAPSASALRAAFAVAAEKADDIWGTAGGPALEQGVSAMVMVSDFDSADTDPALLPTWKRRLAVSRLPVFAIPVGALDSAGADALVAASGGVRLNPADLSPLPALLAGVVSKWINPGYRIRYRAKAGAAAQRTVNVAVASVNGTGTYAVPSSPVPAPSFSGLYVTIRYGNLAATRRIAGLQLSPAGVPLGVPDDPAALAETEAALNGITTICIEGGTPTVSAIFDDICASMQSMSALAALGANPTSDEIVKGAGNVSRAPLTLASLLRPTPVDRGALGGLRVAILQDRAVSSGPLEEHADLAVGLNEIVPLVDDRGAAFRAALKTSVMSSAAEAATYADSAYRRLSGKGLTGIQAGDGPAFAAWLKTVPTEGQAAWSNLFRVYEDYHLALPGDASAGALWVISPTTGVAHSVLLDGTGGGLGGEAGGGGGKCHISGEDGEALALAALALECSAAAAEYPFFCNGVNTAASGMCVIQLFEGKGDIGTPVGAIQPWLGLGEAGLGWLDAQIGMMLILITLSAANCI